MRRRGPSYRTLRAYGLTREEARAALGVGEEWEPSRRREAEAAAVVLDVPVHVPVHVPVLDLTATMVGYEDALRWRSICERVADPLTRLRGGAGGPVR